MRRVLVKILKRLRLYRIARWLWFYAESIKRWDRRRRHLRAMLAFYSQFIGEGALCFDVGANMGSRTEVFLKLGGTVVAVEPQDVCVRRLRKKYGGNGRVKIVQKALGEKEGEAEMMLSTFHMLSSLSKDWIDSVKGSDRLIGLGLIGCNWDRSVMVPVTTLDRLIEEYGRPVFCKIDVQGFEFEVVRGLSGPIRAVSLEYSPEFLDTAIDSVRRLAGFGMRWFNYSEGESMRLSLARYVEAEEMCDILAALADSTTQGDVYATCDPSLARVTS